MKYLNVFLVAFLAAFTTVDAAARTDGYAVSGRVIDRITREGIAYAAVVIVGVEGSGTSADSTGAFTIYGVRPGIVQF